MCIRDRGRAVDELEDEERRLAVGDDVVDRDEVRVAQAGGDAGAVQRLVRPLRLGGELLEQHPALQDGVAGQPRPPGGFARAAALADGDSAARAAGEDRATLVAAGHQGGRLAHGSPSSRTRAASEPAPTGPLDRPQVPP